MVGHEQSGNNLAFQDMPLHNFCHVGLSSDPVPHSLRIDHHTGTQLAMVEAAGFISANKTFEIQPLRFILEVRMKFFRTQVCTTAARIVFLTLIRTDEDVSLK